MFRGVMNLDAPQDTPCFRRWEDFIESSREMRIQIILDDANILCLRVDVVKQPTDLLGIVALGAPLGHFHMTPACR